MLCEKKYYTAGAFAVFAGLNLIRFLIFFLPNYVFDGGAAWGYAIHFSGVVFDMMIPLFIAVECFVYRGGRGIGGALPRMLMHSLSTVIYTLPYYYLYSISLSISSSKSILWGAFMAVVLAAVSSLHALLLYLVIRFAARQTVAAAVRARLPRMFSGERSLTARLRTGSAREKWRRLTRRCPSESCVRRPASSFTALR